MDEQQLNEKDEQKPRYNRIRLLYVAVATIAVVAAATAGIRQWMATSDIADEVSNVTRLATTIKRTKDLVKGYEGLDNSVALRHDAIPHTMRRSVDAAGRVDIFTVWDGAVVIGRGDSDQTFSVEYRAVPPDACRQLIKTQRSAGWASIRVGTGQGARVIKPSDNASEVRGACRSMPGSIRFDSES
ncbi:type 4 pilus major pilin [Burkholderia ambifaria]|uniref:Type 4 secretion system PilS N-terminal domain-containing protein n=1 Tax=Burkholderia ambifaria MEX-5 TaxID=396597 RepID=B1T3D3_9BURK|nr:type 4 pilus major pilin [Burkholderia ambifaria]EDT41903.1 conserved hypothetical protein [Burkholderia ambifaria MEX-5]